MMDSVRKLRAKGCITAILSDQTDWLDQLNQRDNIFHHFDAVFNSYHIGKTKRDPSLFQDITTRLNVSASESLFVDDNPGNIDRAFSMGLATHLFRTQDHFFAEMKTLGLL